MVCYTKDPNSGRLLSKNEAPTSITRRSASAQSEKESNKLGVQDAFIKQKMYIPAANSSPTPVTESNYDCSASLCPAATYLSIHLRQKEQAQQLRENIHLLPATKGKRSLGVSQGYVSNCLEGNAQIHMLSNSGMVSQERDWSKKVKGAQKLSSLFEIEEEEEEWDKNEETNDAQMKE
ncbi:unnamed protein product [Protopolystoma xenopodis]|uniref:Uncharacterized protein n=1 Tax=Protopolystoma xenopodis TaxID=117903 RepID=A0A3S5CIT7_9PLAT|nr:unnamed protein product [Protopolystoma xenopodis]